MKKLLAAMFVALLMVGCGEDDTATSAPEPSREPSPAPVNLIEVRFLVGAPAKLHWFCKGLLPFFWF